MLRLTRTGMPFELLKRCVPPSLRRAARAAWQDHELRRAMQRLAGVPLGGVPDRETLTHLRGAWGNEGFSANLDFLEEVARQGAVTPGPVLECGSGLTTLVLGSVAGRRGVEIWTLEHDAEWHARVVAALRRHGLQGVRLCLAPLSDYGRFVWYVPPLERMPRAFQLVVCDGPPGTTPGGRYGLLPVMHERLASANVILLDDASRASESEVLRCWTMEAPLSVQLRELPGGTFAVITVQ